MIAHRSEILLTVVEMMNRLFRCFSRYSGDETFLFVHVLKRLNRIR